MPDYGKLDTVVRLNETQVSHAISQYLKSNNVSEQVTKVQFKSTRPKEEGVQSENFVEVTMTRTLDLSVDVCD